MRQHKRKQQLLVAANSYISQHMPELQKAQLQLRLLDGPPGSPRYTASAEICDRSQCPRAAINGECGVLDCPLRHSIRLLLDRRGAIVQATSGGIHWNYSIRQKD